MTRTSFPVHCLGNDHFYPGSRGRRRYSKNACTRVSSSPGLRRPAVRVGRVSELDLQAQPALRAAPPGVDVSTLSPAPATRAATPLSGRALWTPPPPPQGSQWRVGSPAPAKMAGAVSSAGRLGLRSRALAVPRRQRSAAQAVEGGGGDGGARQRRLEHGGGPGHRRAAAVRRGACRGSRGAAGPRARGSTGAGFAAAGRARARGAQAGARGAQAVGAPGLRGLAGRGGGRVGSPPSRPHRSPVSPALRRSDAQGLRRWGSGARGGGRETAGSERAGASASGSCQPGPGPRRGRVGSPAAGLTAASSCSPPPLRTREGRAGQRERGSSGLARWGLPGPGARGAWRPQPAPPRPRCSGWKPPARDAVT